MATTKKQESVIEIKAIETATVNIRIVGDTPLIVHAWSEKAKREMLEKQMKVAKSTAKSAKSPVMDYINSLYWMDDKPIENTEEAFMNAIQNGARFGFPVTGIKQAACAGTFRMGMSKDMASLRPAFFIKTPPQKSSDMLAEIKGCVPQMREDMVKIAMGTADIRYRGMFTDWYMDLKIQYCTSGLYSLEQIISMINIGGYACGIGEWRPEKDGQYGQFHVESSTSVSE